VSEDDGAGMSHGGDGLPASPRPMEGVAIAR
jgi:hypothetical protein